MVERPAPNPKIQYFHDHECDSDVDRGSDDDFVLRQNERHSVVHYEQAGLDQPYRKELHLLYYQDELGPVHTHLDLSLGVLRDIVSRRYQVA